MLEPQLTPLMPYTKVHIWHSWSVCRRQAGSNRCYEKVTKVITQCKIMMNATEEEKGLWLWCLGHLIWLASDTPTNPKERLIKGRVVQAEADYCFLKLVTTAYPPPDTGIPWEPAPITRSDGVHASPHPHPPPFASRQVSAIVLTKRAHWERCCVSFEIHHQRQHGFQSASSVG